MTEPNGFYYMRARYYDPNVGRFISEDPIGFEGGDVNLYAYVGNNPVSWIDPSGKAPFWDHFRDGYNLSANAGGSFWNSLVRGWNEMAVDFGKYADYEAVHVTTYSRTTSADAVIAAAQEMIATGMLNGVKVPQAVIDHASLDLRTPAHNGSYYGGLKKDPIGSAMHLINESVDSFRGNNGVTPRNNGRGK